MLSHADLFSVTTIRLRGTLTLDLGEPSHAESINRIIQKEQPYLREWLPWVDSAKDLKSSLDYYSNCQVQHKLREVVQFTICDDGVPIGTIGTHIINWSHKSTSIGYWISKEYAGQGIMTDAVQTFSQLLFAKSDLHRLEIRAAVENIASRKVAKKAGYQEEGILRDAEFLYDHFVDLVVHSLLRDRQK